MSLSGYTVVYGGSFDPPHLSHQMTCLYLLEGLDADAVWMIPSFSHPFGKNLTDFDVRRAMCELMARPFAGRVAVLDTERHLGGAGRTYDTLVHLRATHPELKLALAIGADIVADTPRWHRWHDIVGLARVVVVGRSGYPHPDTPVVLPALASRSLRELARTGASLEGRVPASVARYIAAHGLYGLP
jgi:nicotinate-nucleotide adenylyltransferase